LRLWQIVSRRQYGDASVWQRILAIACILPFAISGYHVSQFSQVLIYAIAMLGLNILTGFNGQISLGHGAFYAIGAYTTAILLEKTGIPYWATVPIAGAICLGAGFLFGLPALRLEGLYLALATVALAVATPQILKFKGFDCWTGGVQGIQVDSPAAPFGLPINTDKWIYYFCLIWAIALVIIARNLLCGRTGRAMIAIRDHPLAAATMGVDTALYKSLTFGVSAMYTELPARWGRCCLPMSPRTVSPCSFRSNSWSAVSSAASPRFRAPSSGHYSSSSRPISRIRYRRRRPTPYSGSS